MLAFLNAVVIIGVICSLGYFQANLIIWALAGLLILTELFFTGLASPFIVTLVGVLFIATLIVLFIKPLRRKWISQHLLDYVQKILPPLSQTEKEALEAGDVTWEAELLRGSPHWDKLLSIPACRLTDEEQAFLDNEVDHFCRMINEWDALQNHDMPPEAWDYVRKNGFFSLSIPKEYGGRAFSAYAHSRVVMKIASHSSSAAVTVMVPNSLGPGELLVHYGTKEQKDYYLPRLARSEEIPCFGLTGPFAGSDAGSMKDKGIVCKGMHEGKEVLGIKLTFDKRYITLAPVATLVGLAFKLYDPNKLLSDKQELGITLCLLPSNHPGIQIGDRHMPTISYFMNGPIHGRDVFIPMDWVIGGPEYVGKGWRMLMECLGIGRSISLPSLSVATGKYVFRMVGAYSRIREQFNLPICDFEGIQESLAYIGGYNYMLDAMGQLTITGVDAGLRPSVSSAITKYEATEMLRKVVNHGMDILAGKGVMNGPSNPLLSLYFAAPVAITVEGANILSRNLMIFGQGAIRCHPYLSDELVAIEEPNAAKRLAKFDNLVMAHAGFHINNILGYFVSLTKSFFTRLTRNHSPLSYYYAQIERLSKILAIVTDNAFLLLGGDLKRKEALSARLADVLSNLYIASAVLRFFEQSNKPAADLPIVYWSLELCLYRAQQALFEYWNNFPYKWVACLFRVMLFPLGHAYSLPNDKLRQQVAKTLTLLGEQRDRLTKGMFLNNHENSIVVQFEKALKLVWAADPARKKLHKALKQKLIMDDISLEVVLDQAMKQNILTVEESELIKQAEAARQVVIHVDEFTPESLKKDKEA